jgi:magnesium transporter
MFSVAVAYTASIRGLQDNRSTRRAATIGVRLSTALSIPSLPKDSQTGHEVRPLHSPKYAANLSASALAYPIESGVKSSEGTSGRITGTRCSMSVLPKKVNLGDRITDHMRSDYACLRIGQTVGEALAFVRERSPGGRIIYFYVIDQNERLQGVVPTRRLLLNPLETPITDIMVQEIVSIPQTATVLDACEFFTMHRLLAFPIVDEDRRIVGVVDVELYTTELSDLDRNERNDDLFQLIGVHLVGSQDASPVSAFRNRFPWLLCNISGGIVGAFVAGLFKAQLQQVVALALFIPVVLALAESVSTQSVTLALQVLRGQPPTISAVLNKLRSELMTGLLLGVAGGLVVGLAALIWLGHLRLTLALLGGITGGVVCSALIGVAMPNLLRLIRRDPHVAAGPIALATSDMVTLMIYLNLARWLL